MPDVKLSKKVEASAEIIWKTLLNSRNWAFSQELEYKHLDGFLEANTLGEIKLKGLRPLSFKILTVEHQKELSVSFRLPLARIELSSKIYNRKKSSSDFLIEANFKGFLGWLYRFMMKKLLQDLISQNVPRVLSLCQEKEEAINKKAKVVRKVVSRTSKAPAFKKKIESKKTVKKAKTTSTKKTTTKRKTKQKQA